MLKINGKVDYVALDVGNENKYNENHIPSAINVDSKFILSGYIKTIIF